MKLIEVFYKNKVENSVGMLKGWGQNHEYYSKTLYAKWHPPLEHSGWAPLRHASYMVLYWRYFLGVSLYGAAGIGLSGEACYVSVCVGVHNSEFICERFPEKTPEANQAVWSSDFMGYRKPRRKDKKRRENECY